MSKQEPMLMESPLTNRVFVATSYESLDGGAFLAREKFDVTEQFDALAKQREAVERRARECSTCTERKGHYEDAETIRRQQEHIDSLVGELGDLEWRVPDLMMKLSERDALIRDMFRCIRDNLPDAIRYNECPVLMVSPGCGMSCCANGEGCSAFALEQRMRELGIEVDT